MQLPFSLFDSCGLSFTDVVVVITPSLVLTQRIKRTIFVEDSFTFEVILEGCSFVLLTDLLSQVILFFLWARMFQLFLVFPWRLFFLFLGLSLIWWSVHYCGLISTEMYLFTDPFDWCLVWPPNTLIVALWVISRNSDSWCALEGASLTWFHRFPQSLKRLFFALLTTLSHLSVDPRFRTNLWQDLPILHLQAPMRHVMPGCLLDRPHIGQQSLWLATLAIKHPKLFVALILFFLERAP